MPYKYSTINPGKTQVKFLKNIDFSLKFCRDASRKFGLGDTRLEVQIFVILADFHRAAAKQPHGR